MYFLQDVCVSDKLTLVNSLLGWVCQVCCQPGRVAHNDDLGGITAPLAHWMTATLTRWPLGNLNEILDVIFKQSLVIDGWYIFCALIWMSLDFTDDQSTLVEVMAWCHQATSHYLSQCWPRYLSPYDVTRPKWVNSLALGRGSCKS